jgi:hypothetical protein
LTRLLALLASLALGTTIGLWTSAQALRRGFSFDAIKVGSWTVSPRAASPLREPYAAALVAASGEAPLDATEGLAFHADRDADGRPLSGRCVYRVRGAPPPARYWTLAVADATGRLVENAAHRSELVSSELVRSEDGLVEITLSPRARSGAWLPTTGLDAMAVTLRLYDTPAGAIAAGLQAPSTPQIERTSCP